MAHFTKLISLSLEVRKDTPLPHKIILLLLRKDKKKMAIYHFSVKAISRADGRSAIAAAAYRSGEKLIDQKQQKEQDYTRKTGVEFKKSMPLTMQKQNF